jgi:hypothetical protein
MSNVFPVVHDIPRFEPSTNPKPALDLPTT